jgi:hypothetical protein
MEKPTKITKNLRIIGVPSGIRIGHLSKYKLEALALEPICSVVEIKRRSGRRLMFHKRSSLQEEPWKEKRRV